MSENAYLMHLSQWVVDHQEEILKYSVKDQCDYIVYEDLLSSLKEFENQLEKF